LNKKRQILLLKLVVWLIGLTPATWLVWRALMGRLGANPIEEILHRLGGATLILLLTTLSVTPIRRITGWNILTQIRRPLGLFGFFYLTMHFLAYAVLDQTLDWEFILEDLTERRYIIVGFTAWVLLIPLAVTSTKGWIRRLGKRWQKLHRLAYVSTALGVLHFYWQVKADTYWPLVATTVLVILMLFRVRSRKGGTRAKSSRTPSGAADPSAVEL
jgi:sulfoxide reductase heme-binding subunit YedZ